MGTRSLNYLVLRRRLWRPTAVSQLIGDCVESTSTASLFIFESNFTPMFARDGRGEHCAFDLEQEVALQRFLGCIPADDFRLVRAGEEFGARGMWTDHPFTADRRVVGIDKAYSDGAAGRQPSPVAVEPPEPNPFSTASVLSAPWTWRDVRSEDGNRRIALLLQTTVPGVPLNDPVIFALREDWLGKLSPERAVAMEMVRRAPEMFVLLEQLADYAESATLENDPLPDCVVEAKLLANGVYNTLTTAAR